MAIQAKQIWDKVSPDRAQEIEKIKLKSHHVGSEIYGVK